MTSRRGRARKGNQEGGVCIDATHLQATSSSASSTPPPPDSSSSAQGANRLSSYQGFQEDIDATFAENFSRLAIDQNWTEEEARARRLEAFDEEFNTYFGKDISKLEGWQQMCRDCDIEPVPPSITQCKKALAEVHVNIFNFLDHRKNPERFPLIFFPNVKKLRRYSVTSVPKLVYPLARAKQDTFLKALLRPFFFNRQTAE